MFTHDDLSNLIENETLKQKINCNERLDISVSNINNRIDFIGKYGIFGFPSLESIQGVIEYAKSNNIKQIIDVGAGVGYIAYGLDKISKQQNEQIVIKAIDNFSFHINYNNNWYNVENADAITFLENIHDSLIVLCWPDYDSDFATNVARVTFKNNNKMIYIGEQQYGCTGNDDFFDNFKLIDIDIPWVSWSFIYDNIFEVLPI